MRLSQVRITRKDSRMQIENFTLRYGNLNFKFSARDHADKSETGTKYRIMVKCSGCGVVLSFMMQHMLRVVNINYVVNIYYLLISAENPSQQKFSSRRKVLLCLLLLALLMLFQIL